MPLFDVHCHLSHSSFSLEHRTNLFHEAVTAGVQKIAVVATDQEALSGALALQDLFGMDRIKVVAATPPHDITSTEDPMLSEVWRLAKEERLSAIGETGLEYFYSPENKELQKTFLHRYIECALTFDLPLVIHCREAFSDMIPLIESYRQEKRPLQGMIHCFTGTLAEAKKLIDLGWYLSFSGIVTFPKSTALQEVAKYVPLDRMLIETDAPWLAPKQKRGQENRPAYLVYTAEYISHIRSLPFEDIARATFKNAEAFFGDSL